MFFIVTGPLVANYWEGMGRRGWLLCLPTPTPTEVPDWQRYIWGGTNWGQFSPGCEPEHLGYWCRYLEAYPGTS